MTKILIVEDDLLIANVYRNKFANEGFEVRTAADGQIGADTFRQFRPDAVILDLMLPKVPGVELIRLIRAEPDAARVPIIVFSNTFLTNLIQDAWKAGATKCLSKSSCTPKQVVEAVRSAIAAATATAAAPAPVPVIAEPVAPAPAAASDNGDTEFLRDIRQTFFAELPATLVALRTQLQGIIKTADTAARVKQLQEMARRVHSFGANAAIVGVVTIAQVTDALEALLRELYEKPVNLNASTLRTVAAAVDFLALFVQRGLAQQTVESAAPNILVVDDEIISRRAVTHALEKAKLKSVNVDNPAAAYKLLTENKYDLVFLDVDMPGMTGFELCTKLRALPAHKKTPVVFVTSLNDFESRANSTMSGGTDFIGKPFLFIELAVKSLVYVLRARVMTA